MGIIRFKRGQKINLPELYEGEPAFTTDEKELYIGTSEGSVKLTSKSEVEVLNNKAHTHSNKSILDSITSVLISGWNNAVNHISDTIKHITSEERTLWNTVSNKVDKVSGKGLSTNDFSSTYKSKIDGIATSATNVQKSTTNGNIKINNTEVTVYSHPTGTNPHRTTKSDVGLSNVTNDTQVKRTEMGVASGVATLDSSGVNAQAPKAHTHDDRYYTEEEADKKFATKSEISNGGYGDMLKSVYDTNGDGVVDKAASVEWSGVLNKPSTFTPASHTHNYAGSSSAGGAATSALTCTGNSATATKLATARTVTIGNTKKTFNGSTDVSWSLSEIGAAASDHTHNYKKGGPLTWNDLKS